MSKTNYTIIADSCGDLSSHHLTNKRINFVTVPITLTMDEENILDAEGLDTKTVVQKMRAAKKLYSACPSPEDFMQHMRENDNIIIVTLSSKLSGTHGSAQIACEQIKAEYPDKKIFLLDTLSASAGVAHILFRLAELIEDESLCFDAIAGKISEIRDKTRVRFLLQDFSNLVKTGRIKKMVGAILGITPVKLICGDDGQGEIKKFGAALGTKKGIQKLAGTVDTDTVTITHCHNETEATLLRTILEKAGITKIKTILMRGCATFYANDKGIVIAY